MKTQALRILCFLILFPSQGMAQGTSSSGSGGLFQYRLDLQYLRKSYEEPSVMTEKGQFTVFRGEAFWWYFGDYGGSIGGYYTDGNMNYNGATFGGTPVQVVTKDYIFEYFLKVHARIPNWEFSLGYAHRVWHNDLVISYTRKTKYTYYPLSVTYKYEPFFVRLEYRIWGEGKNLSTMSRVNASARDVTFTQNSGSGYVLEVGAQYPWGPMQVKTYLALDLWYVDDSDIQNDNTQNLIEPGNSTESIILGVGFIY